MRLPLSVWHTPELVIEAHHRPVVGGRGIAPIPNPLIERDDLERQHAERGSAVRAHCRGRDRALVDRGAAEHAAYGGRCDRAREPDDLADVRARDRRVERSDFEQRAGTRNHIGGGVGSNRVAGPAGGPHWDA